MPKGEPQLLSYPLITLTHTVNSSGSFYHVQVLCMFDERILDSFPLGPQGLKAGLSNQAKRKPRSTKRDPCVTWTADFNYGSWSLGPVETKAEKWEESGPWE